MDYFSFNDEIFKNFFYNLPAISFIVDIETGFFIDANKKAAEFYGYSREEFKNITIEAINPFTPVKETKDFRAKALKEGYNFRIFKHRLRNGEVRDIEAHISGISYDNKLYVQAIIHDITEKKALEDEQESNLFKILIENIHSGIALYDKDKFIYANSALQNLFGYTKEEFFNMNINQFFDINENQVYSSNTSIFKIHRNNEISSRFVYTHNDNTDKVRYLDLFRTAVYYNGEKVGLAIFSDVTDQVLKERHILIEKETYKVLSEIDTLTGINNRRAFDNRLTELLDLAKRYGRPLSLIIFDIDRFKNINDEYGHDAGDIILKELAAAAKEELRKSDFFARYGGEEFTVIAPETCIETAKNLAERLRLKIQNYDFKIGKPITVSLGVTSLNNEDTGTSIVFRADMFLYKAKESGRNRVETIC